MPLTKDARKYLATLLSVLMMFIISAICLPQQAQADPPRRPPAHTVKKAPYTGHKTYQDQRFQHNRAYPLRGSYYRHIPGNHRVVTHHHSRYYAHDGVWYRYHGGGYVVVAPPVGLMVPFLPFAYTTIWMNGIPYYYANDTYYTRTPGGYVVVEPPQGEIRETFPAAEDSAIDSADDRMFIYPRHGQSQEQQDNDRYECHQWAVEQTRYDPTKFPASMPPEQVMQKRTDYQKAMTECLDRRGYTAK